jgi:hypothetical protein
MSHVWAAALAAVMFLSGCSAVDTKPTRLEMPSAKRHFIVMGSPTLP